MIYPPPIWLSYPHNMKILAPRNLAKFYVYQVGGERLGVKGVNPLMHNVLKWSNKL